MSAPDVNGCDLRRVGLLPNAGIFFSFGVLYKKPVTNVTRRN
jgi:hypothetical protein